jgi:hypothetical protein
MASSRQASAIWGPKALSIQGRVNQRSIDSTCVHEAHRANAGPIDLGQS